MTPRQSGSFGSVLPNTRSIPKKQDKNQKNLNKGAQKLLKDFPPGPK
jgi:hypothetical protein